MKINIEVDQEGRGAITGIVDEPNIRDVLIYKIALYMAIGSGIYLVLAFLDWIF